MAKNKNYTQNKENASKFEKGITKSKLSVFFDWVWRLFIINTFTLVTSLGVITILPAMVACFRTVKECYENDEQHIVKRYYANFVYCFLDTVGVGCLFTVIFAALIYSLFYYTSIIDGLRETGSGETYITIFWFLFFLSLALLFVISLVSIQLPMVVTYIRLRFFDKIKFAFYMTFKYFAGSIEQFCLVFMWGIIVFVVWTIVPIVFCFLTTLPMFFIYRLSRKYYWAIEHQTEFEYEEDKYDLQGKSKVRETYEDENKTNEITTEKTVESENK